jgi:GT2 family glycosyltransferase
MPKIIAFTKNRNDAVRPYHHDNQPGDAATGSKANDTSLEQSRAATILISVVVPTCGRPHLLSRCLAALILQRFNPSSFEIIVVDDAPNEQTREVVMNWAQHAAQSGPVITYIASAGPHGPAAARNRGWHAARGRIIGFTDDDTVARTDWLEKGLHAFQTRDVQAVWGRIIMPLNRTPTDYERDAKNLERAEFVTANCFCLKSVLEQLDGFDERFRFAWREDADLYFRLLRSNANIAHIPAAVVVHPIRPATWGVSLAQQKKILFDALLFKKHPELYRQKIRAAPRWDYYIIVLALLACIAGIAANAPVVAAPAAGIWFALTARFCLMRLRPTVKTPSHIVEMIVTSALIPPLAVFWRIIGALKFRARFV